MGGGGPYIYDGEEWTPLPGYGANRNKAGFAGHRIWAAHQDEAGRFWVIGTSAGMWLYDNEKWSEILDSESKPMGTGDSFIRDTDGMLWSGTSLGIYYLNTEGA